MINQVIERLTSDSTPTPLISARRVEHEGENRKKGLKLSVIVHILLLLIFIFPFLSSPFQPPGQEGIIINFGNSNAGQGDTQPLTEDAAPDAATPPPAFEPIADATPASPPPAPPTPPAQKREAAKPKVNKKVVTSDKSDTPSINKEKEKKAAEAAEAKAEADKKAKQKAEEVRKKEAAEQKKRDAEVAKAKAAAEAKRKAEEEAKRKEEAKKKFGFPGSNKSKGQGNTDTPGDQGKPDGDPNAENLEGERSGKGQTGIGIDLAGRTPTNRPIVEDNSNKVGKVSVSICVNPKGEVISAEQKINDGRSTTQDPELVRLAEEKALEFSFNADSDAIEKQCGSILFTFTVE